MAATLVDINQGCTCKVRLLNPFPTEISIEQSAVLGRAEPIEGTPRPLAHQEDSKEKGNFSSIRRIQLKTKDDTLPNAEGVEQSKRIQETDLGQLPEHLTDLYDRASADLGKDEQVKL